MFWSRYFLPTIKEIPAGTEAASHQLLLRAGLVNMLTSGVYSYLPLGLRVLDRVEAIIRQEMDQAGGQELFLPCLQPLELWRRTGRDRVLKEIMISFKDNRGRELCLGPTHEEVITELVRNYVHSYRQLPVTLYQIQTKFRDELRPRFGVVRACEFIMKDAYSFDRDEAGMRDNYQKMYAAYQSIFRRSGLAPVIIEAESGAMGGDVSHEFLVPAAIGEDEIVVCPDCGFAGGPAKDWADQSPCPECNAGRLSRQVAIELGHVFQLGAKYSAALNAVFLDEDGRQKPIIMGCYGIGVSRLIAAVVEINHDADGIIWPPELAPFDVEVLPVQADDAGLMGVARQLYQNLTAAGMEVLLDDRPESAGRKFHDADLIGIPLRLIIGKRALSEGRVELKDRRQGKTIFLRPEDVVPERLQLFRNEAGG